MRKFRKPNPAFLAHVWRKRARQSAIDFRQLLAETRTSERRFREAIHFLPIPIGIADRQGRILVHNRMFTEVFGYTLEDIPTVDDWLKLAYPDEPYRQQVMSTWQADVELALERGVPTPTRIHQVVCKDGIRRLVEITTQPVGELLATTFNDVTARKQAEESLRVFKSLVENSSDAIGMSTPEGKHYYQNEAFSRLFGEVGENPPETLYVDHEIGRQVFASVMEGCPWLGEVEMYAHDQRILNILLRAYPNFDEAGNLVGLVGIHTEITARKQMENSLRESEARYRQLAENISDVVWTADLSFNITYVSPSIQKLTGDTPEKYITLSLEERHPPATIALFQQVFAEETQKDSQPGVDKNRTRFLEVEHSTTSGATIWTSIHLSFLRDARGEITGIMGVTRDITDRKQAEEALRAAEASYRALVEQIPAVTYIDQADGSGRSSFISPQIESMLGVSRKAWMQADAAEWGNMMHPEDRPRVLAAYRRTVETGQPFDENYRLYRPDGRMVWVDDHAIRLGDASGQPTGVHGVMFDITTRKQTEEALRESQERYRRLAENAPDIIFRYNLLPEMGLAYINPAVQAITGYSPEDCYADPYLMLNMAHPDDAGLMANYLQQRTPPEQPLFMRWIGKDGATRWMESRITPVHDAVGRLVAVEGITRDITARKRAEETLQRHLRYRRCATECIEILAGSENPDVMLARVISTLCAATGTDRASIFRHEEPDGQPCMSQIHEFCAEGIEPQINNPDLQRLPYSMGAPTLLPVLRSRQAFKGVVSEMDNPEREILAAQGIVSLLILPIFQDDDLWGFIGLDDCQTPRNWSNEDVHILASVADVIGVALKRKQAEESLLQQTRFQRLLMDISLTYINLPPAGVSAALDNSLAEIGAFVGADRAYIFDFDFQAGTCSNTHEWCAEGITPFIDQLQAVPLETAPDMVTTHLLGQSVHIADVQALPPGTAKDLMTAQAIKSLLTVPLMDGPTCLGFIGFDSVRQIRFYSDDEQRLLKIFAGLLVNIHRRQRAETALDQTRSNMAAIIENSLDNIWAIDTHYEILYTNDVFAQAFEAVFGVRLAPGVNILQALPEAMRPAWKERYDRAFNGERFIFVDAIETGNATIYVEVAVNPIVHDGQVMGASFFGRDISERKQAERERDIALAKYQTLFETFPLGISVTDEQGGILETNQTAEKLLDIPKEEHIQRDIDSLSWSIIREDGAPMPPDEFASVRALTEQRLVENVRMGILKPDETVTWLNVSAAPLPVPGYGVVITYGDISAQIQAEQALRENNQFVNSLLRAVPVAVFFKDREGRYLGCNDVYTEITGVSAETLRGKTVHELWPGEMAEIYHQKDLDLMRNQEHQVYEFKLRDKDGQTRPVIFAKDVFLDANGQAAGMVGAFLDITERKRMEDLLRIKEWAIAGSINGIALAGLDGNLTFVNPAFLSMWGYEAETEVLGRSSVEFWQEPDNASKVIISLRQRGNWRGELFGKHRDGSTFFVEVAASQVTDASGQPLCLLGVFADITERKRMEDALRESEARYRTLFERANDAIFVEDGEDQIIDVNQRACELLGYTRAELLQMRVPDLIAPEVGRRKYAIENELTLYGSKPFESMDVRKDGMRVPVEVTNANLPNGLFLSIVRDITARKHAETELRRSLERNRAILAAQPDLLFVIDSSLVFLDCIASDSTRLMQPPEKVIGSPVDEILPPYLADLTAEKVRLALQTGQMQIYDYSIAVGSQEMFFESRMTRLNQDSVLVLVRDVTEARRTERALRESEQRFRVLFENAGVGVAQGDTNTGRFLKVNQKYCDILGYTRQEMESIDFSSITYTDDLQQNLELLERLKRGEIREFTLEKRYVRKDRMLVWVLLTVSPLWNPGEPPSTHITVIFDISEQKRAAESLRASEKQYRQLSSLLRLMADTMPDMLWAKNLQQEYIFANQSICDQLLNAADTTEPLGKTDLFFALRERAAHPENPQWHTFGEICRDSDAITLQELKPMQFDEYGNVQGQFLYLDVHKAPLYDDDGELLGVVGSARDVTARKQAEESLKKSAVRAQLQRNALAQLTLNETIAQSDISEALKEITRIISDVLNVARARVWLLSADNAELRCLMLRETGQPPRATQDVLQAADFPGYFEVLLQESILSAPDVYHDQRTQEFVSNYLPLFGIGAMLDVAIQKDGRLVGVICAEHIGGERDWHSDEHSFLSAVAHFTAQLFAQVERKQAEQALRESEERYRSLFTQMLDGVYRSTRAGKFVEVNPAMVKMFGYASREEMLGIDIKSELYFDPTERDSLLLAEGGFGTEIYRMRRKDGSEIWVEDHGYYVSDEHGNILFHEGILRDVTEKVLAEQRILQLNADLEQRVQERTAQLEEANRELESFSYSVSHDLRAPLRAIDGFSRIIMNEHANELSPEAQELLERVRSANENMSHLVDALLGLSRMSRAALRREELDLSPLAREILENLGREHPERQVERVVAGQAIAYGDFRLLRVVLENLLGNAWKFTSKKEQACIEFGVETIGDETVYFVRDNGAGFDARYADKLFGAFQRLHSASEFEGTGIGLATVQRIIHRHGGKVWAESEVGQGATFYFMLGENRAG